MSALSVVARRGKLPLNFVFNCPNCRYEIGYNDFAGNLFCREFYCTSCGFLFQVLEPKQEKNSDHINQPSHYTHGKIESIQVIEDWNLGHHLACVVKYICRHGKKDSSSIIDDLKKARWYLDRHIKNLEDMKK